MLHRQKSDSIVNSVVVSGVRFFSFRRAFVTPAACTLFASFVIAVIRSCRLQVTQFMSSSALFKSLSLHVKFVVPFQ